MKPMAWRPKTDWLRADIEEEERKIEELQRPQVFRAPRQVTPSLEYEPPPPPYEPPKEEPRESWWQRIMRYAPWSALGTEIMGYHKAMEEVRQEHPELTPEAWEAYKEVGVKQEKWRLPSIPSVKEYQEFEQLPWYQQLMYEAPFWIATAAAPSAAGVKTWLGAKYAGAQIPRWASMLMKALTPVAAVETAPARGIKKIARGISAAKFNRAFRASSEYKQLTKTMPKASSGRGALEARLRQAFLYEMQGHPQTATNIREQIWYSFPNLRPPGLRKPIPTRFSLVPIGGGEALLPMNPEKWALMNVPERVNLVTSLGLSGKLGSKAWEALTEAERVILEGEMPITKPPEVPTIARPPVAEAPPAIEGMATNTQKVEAHRIAYNKLLLDPKTHKVTPAYRRLAKGMTGKTSMLSMTEAEASAFIESLNRLEVKFGRAPKIPTTKALITEKMAEKIPFLKEIGKKEQYRPARQVFTKMGLLEEVWEPAFRAEVEINEALAAFEKGISAIEKTIGRAPESRASIFRALENPELVKDLTPTEAEAHKWFRKYFDKRADDLNLPQAKRRQDYVTHIFEENITRELKETHQIPPEIIKAFDFITPKTAFNPYLKERLGQTVGLKEDPFAAARAYEYRALRSMHYTPLIQKIRIYRRFLPPTADRYLRDYIARITNRPLAGDREWNQTLTEFGEQIEKLPGGKVLGGYLKSGNMAQLMAYQYVNLLYFLWLGFKPTSAIRNLSQNFLTLAEVGPVHFFKGAVSSKARAAVKESLVLRSRRRAYLPGIDSSFADTWMAKTREVSMKMFRGADRINVTSAFKAGYAEAESLGLPHEWCVKRGDEVAGDTQYIYTKLAGAAWSQEPLGRLLSPLTTWPENWTELMTRWFRGKPSQVYKQYEAQTGKTVKAGMSWAQKRKSIMIYLAIIATAYGMQKKTRLKALEYTGWTSIRYMSEIIGGRMPALSLPYAVAQMVAGFALGDNRMLKEGWNRLKPENLMGIVRQLERIMSGARDWLTLFFYLENERKKQPAKPPTGEYRGGAYRGGAYRGGAYEGGSYR